MLKTARSRFLAVVAAIAVVAAGVLVPIAATAAAAYPVQAPGSISIGQAGTSMLDHSRSGFPAGTTFGAVQWFRGTTAIPGATSDEYTMTEADHAKLIKVRVTVNVPGFASTARYSPAGNFTFTRSGILSLTGVGQVGTDLRVSDLMEFRDPSNGLQNPDRWYQWRVNGVPLGSPSPTPQLMTVQPEHFGKTITCTVLVENYGIAPQTYSPNVPIKITLRQPILNENNAVALVEKVTNPADGSFVLNASVSEPISEAGVAGSTYQWYRANYLTGAVTAIAGKTAATYAPTAADYASRVFVRATFTLADHQPLVLESYRQDYSVRAENRRVPGPIFVGGQAGAIYDYSYEKYDADDVSDRIYVSVGEDVTHRWMRNGVTVPGQTDYYYPTTKADLGKTLSFAVTVKKDGYLSGLNLLSSVSPKVLVGAINLSSLGSPVFTVNPSTMKVTVEPTGSTFPDSTVTKVQWRRNGVVVFTGMAYQLTAADYGKELTVLMTYSAPGYANAVGASQGFKPWVEVSGPRPVVAGDAVVGGTLTIDHRDFTNAETNNPVSLSGTEYQWFRNGVAVPAIDHGLDPTYPLTELDAGKSITVRMTVPSSGLLPSISTSLPTGIIGDQLLQGVYNQPGVTITKQGTLAAPVLKAESTGITGPAGLVVKYQWFRGGIAVAGATKQTYALTAADRLKQVYVRVTTTHAPDAGGSYTSSIKTSVPLDYSIRTTLSQITSGIPGIVQPGIELVYEKQLATGEGPLGVGGTADYQWLRNGVAIPGATNSEYTPTTADVGKRVTIRATFSYSGFLPITVTAATTPAVVVAGAFDLGTVHPGIDSNTIGTLKVQIPGGVTPVPDKYTYQWLRNGVAISGKTAPTYTLVAADAGKDITVRVTAVRTGYVSAALPVTSPWDPDIDALGPLVLDAGPHKVGETIGTTLPSYSTDAFGVASVFPTYRWLRNGAVISGQTGNTYTLGNADLNASIQAQVTVTLEGHLARTDISAGTFPTAKGTTTSDPIPVVTVNPTAATLTASITGMEPATPAPKLTYQWLRNDNPIANATAATYRPVAADATALLSVRITVNRGAAFDVPVLGPFTSTERTFRAHHGVGDQPLTISGTAQVGQTLTADYIPYVDEFGNPVAASILRTWYRNNVPIAGAVNLSTQTYTLTAADEGKSITVRETMTSSTTLPLTVASPTGKGPIAKGTLTGSFDFATVTKNAQGFLVPTITPGTINQPGPYVLSYVWKRNSGTILSTAATYKLTAADTGQDVRVWITVGKAGYTTVPDAVIGLGNWLMADDTPHITGADSPHIGSVFGVAPLTFSAPGNPAYTLEYLWYRNGAHVEGETGPTYVVTAADVGATVTVRVRAVATAFYYPVWFFGQDVSGITP